MSMRAPSRARCSTAAPFKGTPSDDRNEALALATHRHYKVGLYRVIGVARHSETEEAMIVYEHLWPHERGLWVPPAAIVQRNARQRHAALQAARHPALKKRRRRRNHERNGSAERRTTRRREGTRIGHAHRRAVRGALHGRVLRGRHQDRRSERRRPAAQMAQVLSRRWAARRCGGRCRRATRSNLKADEGKDIVRRLAKEVDIVIENFRPGLLEKLGLGYDTLCVDNPGFGAIAESMGGLRHITGLP